MPVTTPEHIFTVHPDIVTEAIRALCWVIATVGTVAAIVGGGLIKVLLYIWGKADGRISNVEDKMDKIAHNIENMDKSTAVEISGIKLRCALIHQDNPHAHVRSTDLLRANEEAQI